MKYIINFNLFILIIIQLFNFANSYNYIIGDETNILINVPASSNSWLNYYFFITVDICEYVNNDSYIIVEESQTNITDYLYKTYSKTYNNKEIKIYGSDLKFIDYGVFTPMCSEETTDIFTITEDGNKFKIKVDNDCFPTFLLYIIKNDNSDFINLCDLYNNKDIIYKKDFSFTSEKTRTLEFKMDNSSIKYGKYKAILIAKKNSMLFKYKPQILNFHKTSSSSSFIIIIVICFPILIIITVLIMFLIKKRKDRVYNISSNKYSTDPNKNNPDFMTEMYEPNNSGNGGYNSSTGGYNSSIGGYNSGGAGYNSGSGVYNNY